MRVHLGGHLDWYDPAQRSWLEISQTEPITAGDLALRLGVPVAEIAITVVNGRAAELESAVVADDDQVEFFPPFGGG